ncbi:MAG TPA: type II secretion system F family protein [Stellaceae bacterium]|nr:type II secretion system F family protein [Stellaceae bacterium]
MARFEYSALSAAGDLVSGELDGPDAASIIERLHERALLPIHAVEKRSGKTGAFGIRLRASRSLPGRDLALFSQQLARLLKANLPLDRALEILTGLAADKRSGDVIRRTLERVQDGAGLAEAMAAQQKAFPPAYVSMVRAGEIGGALQAVLARIADFLVRTEAIRQTVASALIYPALLAVVAVLAVTLVLTVVLPQFEPVFRDAGASLPVSTQIVMSIGNGLRDYWWALLLAMASAAIGWQLLMQRPGMALRRDRLVLALPIVRDLVGKFEISRFSRTLGVLLANGVPAPRALALCGAIIGNRVIAAAVETVSMRLKEGEGLSTPLSRTGRFPSLSIQLIRIGEETGRLEEMLQEIAEIYEQEVQRALERLLALLVPAITITMGMIIALIIVAVMTAMISINDLAV